MHPRFHTIIVVLRNITCGILIGGANVIPGLSGGTVAVIAGVYGRIIDALSLRQFKQHWKQHGVFLLCLLVGAVIGVLVLAWVLEPLLKAYPFPVYLFFIGLILGGVPGLWVKYAAMKPVKKDVIWFAVGALPLLFLLLPAADASRVSNALLFVSGLVAASAMVIPGISGSFVLLVMGTYQHILAALNEREIVTLIIFGGGVVLGIFLVARIMRYLFAHVSRQMWAVIISLVVISSYYIVPGLPQNIGVLFVGCGLGVVGFAITFFSQRFIRPHSN